MKTALARSTDLLTTLSTIGLASGIGFLFVCVVHLSSGEKAAAKNFWDAGLSSLIAGCALGAGACKCSQVRRELNQ
jgi:hypothetical protein